MVRGIFFCNFCVALNTCNIVVDVEIKELCISEVCCENEELCCLVHESGGVFVM